MQAFQDRPDPRDDVSGERFVHAWVDLVGDDEKELIAEYPAFAGTGGRSLTIMQRKHGR
jgi:hypothetical protein